MRQAVRAVIVFGSLFSLIAFGVLWHFAAPERASFVYPSPDGHALLAAAGTISPGKGDDALTLPPLLRVLSQLRAGKLRWLFLGTPGEKPRPVSLKIDIDPLLSVPPILSGGDSVIISDKPDMVSVYSFDGKLLNSHSTQGREIRAFAGSRDGKWIAWSDFGKSGRGVSFGLYTADSKLTEVREVSLGGIYPQLGPGSIEWGPDGRLYFSGFNRENHDFRAAYSVEPLAFEPMESGRDRGLVFAISPDGTKSAAGGARGLRIIDTANGGIESLWPGEAMSVVKPSWSPNGDRIAFVLNPRRRNAKGPKIIIADSGAARIMEKSGTISGFLCGQCQPFWTPNGKTVLVNGFTYSSRGKRLMARRRVTAVFDTESKKLSFPDNPAKLWK